MVTAFNPQVIKTALAEGHSVPAEAYTAYLQHYHIDFREQRIRQTLEGVAAPNCKLASQLFQVPNPLGTVLLLHGYLDHHALYRHLIHFCLERRLSVISFDLPGHGLSGGEVAGIGHFAEYQQALESIVDHYELRESPLPVHLFGQSTGAAIINQYLLSKHPAITGSIVLFAPLVRPSQWGKITLLHGLLHRFMPSIPRHYKFNSHDADFIHFVREQDPLQSPIINTAWLSALKQWLPEFIALPSSPQYRPLIIQGTADITVDWPYNLKILGEKFPQARILRLEGALHHLANESETFRQPVYQWIDSECGFTRSLEIKTAPGSE